MSELIGRFLSFEEHLGRGLVKFVYYVLLFLLMMTTLYDLGVAVGQMFGGKFWLGLGKFVVRIPLEFIVSLLLLRVGAELIMAVLSIDDHLRSGIRDGDTMSSGLNAPSHPPAAAPTLKTPSAEVANDLDDDAEEPTSEKTEEEGSEGETTEKE
ncbi:DUF4282 domain-containing protein [Parvularcula lutaonensis]|uniref:DUF4282 domain-containing protein n=1 Tax=Parvularcula lutaonensis TaxID=491923 RepID=A0ABV7M9Y3_9PROT|nr:DUF4282 domain-containing protein [Parvularcula lutaonensis]GGY46572.1 hypothetical protein GCM10007148_14600 [Parvularcula lutaonensis]